jgi:glucokinase
MKALVADFGGSHATCGLVEEDRLHATEAVDVGDAHSIVAVLPAVGQAFRRLLTKSGFEAADCEGVVFGLPSIVDARTGTVLDSRAKYEDVVGFDLNQWTREQFGLRLRAENDARMALLGESYAGAGRGVANLVMITLGTGIGGTTMIEGKLLRGKHSQAGCLGGHMPVLFNGRRCMCGAIGCAEAEASSWALPAIAKDWPGILESRLAPVMARLDFALLFQAAEEGDEVACQIRDRCLRVWSVAAVGMVHAYDPEVLILGGGVLKSEKAIIPFVQQYLDQHAWTVWGKVRVRAAELGNNAALLGAVALLMEKFD